MPGTVKKTAVIWLLSYEMWRRVV